MSLSFGRPSIRAPPGRVHTVPTERIVLLILATRGLIVRHRGPIGRDFPFMLAIVRGGEGRIRAVVRGERARGARF